MQKPAQFRLKAAELMPLSVKSNWPTALHAAGHLGAIVISASALWLVRGSWWALPLTLLQGYLIAFLFTVVHEMAHQTAFRTRALNYLLGHFAAFVILLPYEYYRAYHWDHHRYTQDPQRDPELSSGLPASTAGLLWFWSGLPTWIGRIRMLLVHGFAGRVREPWVAENKHALIVREARCYLLGYAAIVLLSLAAHSLAALWLWIIPVMLGQWFLRPYLAAEHTGCAHSANMLENTRTIYTNAVVRYFAWNMPYHVEHHAYPAVPFHALPQLNRLLAAHISNSEQGYRAASVTVLRYLQQEMRAAAPAEDA